MGTILFECPTTGRPVSTGIETEPVSFCRVSKTWLEVYCPLCGRFHGAKRSGKFGVNDLLRSAVRTNSDRRSFGSSARGQRPNSNSMSLK
jgi:endogenous inhibitor of DNA gyrase (YacG/DUF329 family)